MSARTWGEGGGQSNVDRPGQGEGVRKIPKFVRTSFMDDPLGRSGVDQNANACEQKGRAGYVNANVYTQLFLI